MEHQNYVCLRCKCRAFEAGEIHVAGSVLGKIFDVEGTKFSTVTCVNCRHTEFFKTDQDNLNSVLDLFVT